MGNAVLCNKSELWICLTMVSLDQLSIIMVH